MSSDTHYVRSFFRFLSPYRKPLIAVYALYFCNALLNLLPAYSVRFYIDWILLEKEIRFFGIPLSVMSTASASQKVCASFIYLLGMLCLIVLANTIGVVMWRRSTRVTEKILFDLKIQIHNQINRLSLNFFHQERIGSIMTKAVSDVQNLSMLFRNSFNLSYALVQVIIAPILMLTLSPLLFVVSLFPMPIIIYAFYSIRLKLRPMYTQQRENLSLVNSQIQEIVSGIREIKAFNMEDRSQDSYRTVNWHLYDLQNQIMKIYSFNHQLQYGTKDFTLMLIAVAGGVFILLGSGNVTVGMITSFVMMAGFLFNPINMFFGFFNIIQNGMASLERIMDFLHIVPEVKDRKNAMVLHRENISGCVSFSHVNFAYRSDTPVLKDISLEVTAGKTIAVVGVSGSGKSTMMSLLLRFYDVGAGTIEIDGVDIRTVTQESLRRMIGVVFQEPFLFYGSIRENLLFANPDKTGKDMIEACKAANIYDTIMQWPHQFDTKVGERGIMLSGGQKQRIAIARIFLKDPAIVILDEATSSVDTVTEYQIQQSIDAMLRGRTAFIIAHRLSTVKRADMTVVLDGGRIVETGVHDQLLEKNGRYAQLYAYNLK
jgi:ABC-type multidrug transport system fused ATPase/permease subunit